MKNYYFAADFCSYYLQAFPRHHAQLNFLELMVTMVGALLILNCTLPAAQLQSQHWIQLRLTAY